MAERSRRRHERRRPDGMTQRHLDSMMKDAQRQICRSALALSAPERAICTGGGCACRAERGRRYCRGHGHHRRRRALRAGQIATTIGWVPTVMGADTAPVAVVITDTVPSLL